MIRYTRWREEGNGVRYIARTRSLRPIRSEHAVWRDGRVQWNTHPEGGLMQPFLGPDEAWENLISDAAPYPNGAL